MNYKMPFKYLINPGHSACAGCGELLAMRHVLEAAGKNTIVANATGCSEVTTTKFPTSAFKVPWVHANFENAIAVASGVLSALKAKGEDENVNLLAWGGDGATYDIGTGLLSGSWERGENILYVCLDNEAYMNTGMQASGSTPLRANTTTTQPGKESFGNELRKKNMLDVALAHNCVYAASATCGNLVDIQNKVKKALKMKGPKYLQILVTCVPGWYTEPKDTIKVAKLAQQTGLYPVVEYIDGKLVGTAKCPDPKPAVEEYLKLQGRFKHLFKDDEGKVQVGEIQKIADLNCEKYKL
jgi:pyruvate ferredoxin oxidoreductase beta subunit